MEVQLSPHFRLSEFLNLGKYPKNVPDAQSLVNLAIGCTTILEPARVLLASPIVITSGFRNNEVNKAVGGVENSQHLVGCAADIKVRDRIKFSLLIAHLRSLPFDQLLVGHGWCHVSWSPFSTPRHDYRPGYYTY